MSVQDFKRKTSGQPITVKISRQMADHTMVEAVFTETDDQRCVERTQILFDLFDTRMIATNEKIMASTDRINAAVDAKLAEAKAAGLNGGSDGPRSDRAAHLSADS